jgi:hypothetical protein
MKCFNCNEEMNPTLLYCNNCGVPMENDAEDIIADAEERALAKMRFSAVMEARGYLVTAAFLLASTIGLRFVLLKQQSYDHFPAYRAPLKLVDEEGYDPPVALNSEPMRIELPE